MLGERMVFNTTRCADLVILEKVVTKEDGVWKRGSSMDLCAKTQQKIYLQKDHQSYPLRTIPLRLRICCSPAYAPEGMGAQNSILSR